MPNNEPGTQWAVASLTAGLISLLHVVRLLSAACDARYGADHLSRELLIAPRTPQTGIVAPALGMGGVPGPPFFATGARQGPCSGRTCGAA